MENNILFITLQKQLKSLFFFIVLFFIYVFILYYFLSDSYIDRNMAYMFVGFFCCFLLPALILHVEYYIRNKGEEYELLDDKIILHKNNETYTYTKDDIKKIIVYVSPNYYNDFFYVSAFENYHFAKVELKNGKFLYLTSLLAPRGVDKVLKVYLKDVYYIRKKRLFATTLY